VRAEGGSYGYGATKIECKSLLKNSRKWVAVRVLDLKEREQSRREGCELRNLEVGELAMATVVMCGTR